MCIITDLFILRQTRENSLLCMSFERALFVGFKCSFFYVCIKLLLVLNLIISSNQKSNQTRL